MLINPHSDLAPAPCSRFGHFVEDAEHASACGWASLIGRNAGCCDLTISKAHLLWQGLAGDEQATTMEGQVSRLHAIEALLAAMRKRLLRVEATIMQDRDAAYELCCEEGPMAGCNTGAAPTPVPGASANTRLG